MVNNDKRDIMSLGQLLHSLSQHLYGKIGRVINPQMCCGEDVRCRLDMPSLVIAYLLCLQAMHIDTSAHGEETLDKTIFVHCRAKERHAMTTTGRCVQRDTVDEVGLVQRWWDNQDHQI